MNILWILLIISGISALLITNQGASVLTLLMQSGDDALKLCMGLTAVYCVWFGIIKLAEDCGAVKKLSSLLRPIIKKLFGSISDEATDFITLNISANLIGVSNAATPSAVSAMREIDKTGDGSLSFPMLLLFMINLSGLQIVPTTIIGLRASYLSASPSDILLPNLISTALTTLVSIGLAFLFKPKQKSTVTDIKFKSLGNKSPLK